MMRPIAVAALILFSVVVSPAAFADDDTGDTSLTYSEVKHVEPGTATNAFIAANPGHTYRIEPVCELGGTGTCAQTTTCSADGHDGTLYEVYQDDHLLDWRACLTDAEADHLGALTPTLVTHAFQRLTWPTSPLQVQPPHGHTLVNLPTNFFTTNTHPTRQTLTLLGHHVTIEATPTTYTWHYDPDHAETTTTPGAPYPDLTHTHRYPHPGTTHPSLDTTYTGRYQIDHGPWHPIPDTLTVPGPPQTLHIHTATPHLTGD